MATEALVATTEAFSFSSVLAKEGLATATGADGATVALAGALMVTSAAFGAVATT